MTLEKQYGLRGFYLILVLVSICYWAISCGTDTVSNETKSPKIIAKSTPIVVIPTEPPYPTPSFTPVSVPSTSTSTVTATPTNIPITLTPTKLPTPNVSIAVGNVTQLTQLTQLGVGRVLRISTTLDHHRMVAAMSTGISIYGLPTLQEIVRVPVANGVSMASLAPDNVTLAWTESGEHRNQVRIAALNSRDLDAIVVDSPNGEVVVDIGFSPDSNMLAVGTCDTWLNDLKRCKGGMLWLWDIGQRTLSRIFSGTNGGVRRVAFSSNGRLLASALEDGTIKLWDLESRKEIFTLSGEHAISGDVIFSTNSRQIVSGDNFGNVILWDVESGREVQSPGKHRSDITHMAFSPDGRYLATTSNDRTIKPNDTTGKPIKLWDMSTNQEVATFIGHDTAIATIAFSSDGLSLISASQDGEIKRWSITEQRAVANERLPSTLLGHKSLVTGVAFSRDGRMLASCSYDKTVKLWDWATGGIFSRIWMLMTSWKRWPFLRMGSWWLRQLIIQRF